MDKSRSILLKTGVKAVGEVRRVHDVIPPGYEWSIYPAGQQSAVLIDKQTGEITVIDEDKIRLDSQVRCTADYNKLVDSVGYTLPPPPEPLPYDMHDDIDTPFVAGPSDRLIMIMAGGIRSNQIPGWTRLPHASSGLLTFVPYTRVAPASEQINLHDMWDINMVDPERGGYICLYRLPPGPALRATSTAIWWRSGSGIITPLPAGSSPPALWFGFCTRRHDIEFGTFTLTPDLKQTYLSDELRYRTTSVEPRYGRMIVKHGDPVGVQNYTWTNPGTGSREFHSILISY